MSTFNLSLNLVVSNLLRKMTPDQFQKVMFKIVDIPGEAPVKVTVSDRFVSLNHDHPDKWSWHITEYSQTCNCRVDIVRSVGGFKITLFINDYRTYNLDSSRSQFKVVTPEELIKLGYA